MKEKAEAGGEEEEGVEGRVLALRALHVHQPHAAQAPAAAVPAGGDQLLAELGTFGIFEIFQ